MSTNQPQLRAATDAETGRSCPYCRFAFKPGIALAVCWACRAPHHADCWGDNGGCAVIGCRAGPAGTTPIALTEPLPTVASASRLRVDQADSGGYRSPTIPDGQRKSNRSLIAAFVAVALAGAAVVVALVVTGHHGSGSPTSSVVVTPGSSSPAVTTTTTTKPTTTASTVPARQQVVKVLRSYESDYSDHNLNGLSALFTPGVTRFGDRSGGCGYVVGKSAVLSAYAAQFAVGTGAYRFLGLSPSVVHLNGEQASTTLAFTIAVGAQNKTGQVSFGLGDLTGHWLVRHIRATC